MSKWEKVKLGEIGVIITGNTPKTSDKENYSSKDISFYKPSDIAENNVSYLNISEAYVSEVARSKVRILPKGSILVTCIGIIGKIGILEHEATCNQQINAIIPDQDICLNRYIAYSIFFNRDKLRDIANAPVVPIVNKTQFSNMIIPLPPLEEQKRIADILDKASNLINLRKQQLEKMDLLVKSKFIDIFGDPVTNPKRWPKKTFLEVAIIDTNMTTAFEKYADLPHIGIDCIEKNTGKIISYQLIKESNLISGKYIFDKRHIIYSKIRPNLNKVALPSFAGLCSADAYPILPTESINRYFLAYIMRSNFFLDYILSHSDRTNIPKVNKAQLNSFTLPVPPMSLQNKFAEFVEQVEKQKAVMQQSLEKMEKNYKALMQEYF